MTKLMMATSSVALLVAGCFSLYYDAVGFRHSVADQLHSLADVTGANTAAALTFHDPKSAALVLEALRTEPYITAACLYDADGRVFASYQRDSSSTSRPCIRPAAAGDQWRRDRVTDSRPVIFDGEFIGTVSLESDLNEMQQRRRQYAVSALTFTLASSAAAFLMALWLKRFISRPILDLVRTAKTVSREKNFAIRATPHAKDDLGLLVDGFNEMLSEIEKRDSRLKSEVAERIRAEEALREREAELQLLLDSTAEAIYGIDLQGNCTFANSASLRLLGYEKSEDLLGKNLHRQIHHSHADGRPYPVEGCPIYSALGRGDGTHIDNEVVWRADGTCFPVEYWSYPVWRGWKLVGCVVTFVDITGRKRSEDALRAAHNESELFINSVPSILIGTDAQGHITRWNLAAANTFGLAETAVRGRTLKDCGIVWMNAGIDAEIDSWVRVERSEKRDNLMFQRNSDRHFLGITISRVDCPHEENRGFLITGTDVTERKQLEEQLRQAQKLEAIGQLAAGIAHEINTPAQYVGDNTQFLKESWPIASELLGLCQTLHAESNDGGVKAETISRLVRCTEKADLAYLLEETPRAIEQSLEGVQRVAKIVKAIKEFSHPGSEEKRAIDINRAIETTITVARNEWKYVADVFTHFDTTLPPVPCLAGEFNQVILNLLINAAQAIGEAVGDGSQGKGAITITTRREGEQAEIRIQDTGKGVPEAIRARIFEPFFTTKAVGKGTGQGLAIAHTVIVKKHDGQIWFDSEVGKGTTFFVRLPLVASSQSQ